MRVLRLLGLSLGSLIGFVVVCEIVVRLAGPDLTLPGGENRFRFSQDTTAEHPHHVRDDRLGWRLAPDQQSPLGTNSRGFRTPEFDLAPPTEDVFRIVVVGDSNPLGFGLTDDAAPYPARLQTLIDDFVRPGLAEVINLGVDGYSSHQVRMIVEEYVPALRPHMLVVQVGFNDYCLAPVADADHDFARSRVLNALETSHAYRWFRRVLLKTMGSGHATTRPVPRASPRAYEANLRAIVATAREHGADPVLLTTPVRPAVPLVINEVEIVSGGRSEWITQDRWLRRELSYAGVYVDSIRDDRYDYVVREAIEVHPDWAILPFMLSRSLRARGREDEAMDWTTRWQELDHERDKLERYMDGLRSAASGAVIVDVGELLAAFLETEQGRRMGTDLFIDFVHLDERGHVVVAASLATRLTRDQGWAKR